ncbi:MAG: NusG domain II-containing protein [Firmicutes bacterium]|nr:NusG domain II-containing protein [Bacillota bacterium]
MLKKGDWGLIFGSGLLLCFLIAWNGYHQSNDRSKKTAVIMQAGKVIQKINLNKLNRAKYIRLNQGIRVVILAEKGRIRFLDSGCRDKICVRSGWLMKNGDKAVCMPSKTVIMIQSGGQPTDSISY